MAEDGQIGRASLRGWQKLVMDHIFEYVVESNSEFAEARSLLQADPLNYYWYKKRFKKISPRDWSRLLRELRREIRQQHQSDADQWRISLRTTKALCKCFSEKILSKFAPRPTEEQEAEIKVILIEQCHQKTARELYEYIEERTGYRPYWGHFATYLANLRRSMNLLGKGKSSAPPRAHGERDSGSPESPCDEPVVTPASVSGSTSSRSGAEGAEVSPWARPPVGRVALDNSVPAFAVSFTGARAAPKPADQRGCDEEIPVLDFLWCNWGEIEQSDTAPSDDLRVR